MENYDIHDPFVINEAVRVLREGGVVMHPTETCYGLAVDIFNKKALEKLYKLKGRDFDKPMSILVYGLGMANEYGLFSEKAFELAQQYWPGPLSLVVPRKKKLPKFLNPGLEFVSLRFSSEEFNDEFVKAFGGPVTTTSANPSGRAPLYEPNVDVFGGNAELIDLVVDGGKLLHAKPSTVVKIEGDRLEVLRQGEVVVD